MGVLFLYPTGSLKADPAEKEVAGGVTYQTIGTYDVHRLNAILTTDVRQRRTFPSWLPHLPPLHSFAMQITRLWLMFPARLITRPVLWELTKKFEVVTNIRQASVTEEIGLVSLELEGERDEIKKTIAWLEEQGIKVEPVEINTIEG